LVNRGETITLEIADLAFGGKGIARLKTEQGDFVLFVENSFPGQKVLVRISKKRRRHAECQLLKILERSPIEQEIPYQMISGAPYIRVPIKEQEAIKKNTALSLYQKIGNIPNIAQIFDTYISSPLVFNYRNKMEYSFSSIAHDIYTDEEVDDAFALGFKHRGTWWKVESLDKPSGMFDEAWETFLPKFRQYLGATGLPAWHPPRKEGFFRHIVIRKSFATNELLINLVTSSTGLSDFDVQACAAFLKDNLGERLAGFQHTINDNVADRAKIENGNNQLIYGKDHIVENLLGLSFEISMESFFQTNPTCAELLYEKALDYVFETETSFEGQIIMDLFCGTGTIGQILSKRANNTKIIGVDIVPEAIADAERNAKRNGIKDIQFYAADVGKFLYNYPEYQGKIHTIVLDPPRAGIAPKTLRKVMALDAHRIVYISCNPATQARDSATLLENGYVMKKLSFVDQFPHTAHIEAVALFEKVVD
jgi:23S rRNA (uracil1939-C5)-methyltransferase